MDDDASRRLAAHLRRIYDRPVPPEPWTADGNLPWNQLDFSLRMLREHLDQSHGAASRVDAERAQQLAWLTEKLDLRPPVHVYDITCGPGLYAVALAEQGCRVTGVDFGPAAIAYALELARTRGVAARCTFVEADVRDVRYPADSFDAALLLYGQLAVMPPASAAKILQRTAVALKPGARLAVELLDPARIDRKNSTWWFTDDRGLWGDAPFLHLGERFWDEEQGLALERFQIIHLETGELETIHLCDQSYTPQRMERMLREAGFSKVTIYSAWDGVALYDAAEWLVYVAEK